MADMVFFPLRLDAKPMRYAYEELSPDSCNQSTGYACGAANGFTRKYLVMGTSRAKVMEALRNASEYRSTGGRMIEDSLAHTIWDCTYHIVWIPKYRRKVLYGEGGREVIEVVRQLLANKKIGISNNKEKRCD